MLWTINAWKDVVVPQHNILALRNFRLKVFWVFLWTEDKTTEKIRWRKLKDFKQAVVYFYFQLLMLTCSKQSRGAAAHRLLCRFIKDL